MIGGSSEAQVFRPGDKVFKSGFEGVVIGEYLPGMYEVRLDSGVGVVPGEELPRRA